MSVHMVSEGGVCAARVDGELTIYTAAEMKGGLLALLHGDGDIELNLAQVSEMDTAGLQLLLLLKREAKRKGQVLRLVDHSQAVLEIMDLFDLAACFGDPVVIPAEQG